MDGWRSKRFQLFRNRSPRLPQITTRKPRIPGFLVTSLKLMFSDKGQRSHRGVPGFGAQSYQKNSKVGGPPSAGAHLERIPTSTSFRKFYQRGDFPLMVEHGSRGNKIAWKTDLKQLDYHYFLPLFFDGLCETSYPYSFIARQGIHDLLEQGGQRILPVLPQLIRPIRSALNTRNHMVVVTTLGVLNKLVTSVEGAGETLVPYYRQILPVLNLFKNQNLNTGDGIDYAQMKNENMGDIIQETLEALEMTGGDEAYYHIKYMIPTYESCMGKSLRSEYH